MLLVLHSDPDTIILAILESFFAYLIYSFGRVFSASFSANFRHGLPPCHVCNTAYFFFAHLGFLRLSIHTLAVTCLYIALIELNRTALTPFGKASSLFPQSHTMSTLIFSFNKTSLIHWPSLTFPIFQMLYKYTTLFIHIQKLFKTIHLPLLISCKFSHIEILSKLKTFWSFPSLKIFINWPRHRNLIRHRNLWILLRH